MDLTQAKAYAKGAMPRLLERHAELISYPSVAFPGYPREPMDAIVPVLLDMFTEFGIPNVGTLELEGGYPAIFAEIPGPEGSPVVTLYGHYDVQPCPPTQKWDTDPWTATRKEDGRIYGRGAADDKSGVVALAGILGAFEGKPPCTVRLVVEGEEETASHIEEFVEKNPQMFASDLFMITDSGPAAVGEPSVGTGLRGTVATTVTANTLPNALHSGLFGGAAPDALFVLLHTLDAMFDDDGNTVIPGLHSFSWEGAEVSEESILKNAEVLAGVSLQGTGPVQNRIWSSPAATVIGLDAVPVDQCSNALNPSARAKVSLRIAPGADPVAELATLKQFLQDSAPLGVTLEFSNDEMGAPFKAVDGPYLRAAMTALEEAYGKPAGQLGSGGAIPLVNVFVGTKPGSEAVIWGPQDEEFAKIHGPNESVHPDEIERIVVAGIRLLTAVAETK
ncbi:MAG: M20/M25/M40 family metallo-hydrolase [Propionibacteriaceae bacterium]